MKPIHFLSLRPFGPPPSSEGGFRAVDARPYEYDAPPQGGRYMRADVVIGPYTKKHIILRI